MPRIQSTPQLRSNLNKKKAGSTIGTSSLKLLSCHEIRVVLAVLCLAFIGIFLEVATLNNPKADAIEKNVEKEIGGLIRKVEQNLANKERVLSREERGLSGGTDGGSGVVPVLPPFVPVPNGEKAMEQTYQGKPTIAGVMHILQTFEKEMHDMNQRLSKARAHRVEIITELFGLTDKYLGRMDKVFRGKAIFPIRDDESIFYSLAAYREHLLAPTLVNAFQRAKHPEKLFVGAVVQNCFGKVNDDGSIDASGKPCKTGFQVVGKDANGRDIAKVSDAPPDPNGIEEFCGMADYKKYCDNGQIRVMYVHETESLGPAMARYYASKMWAGETYFMQTDSHLLFAQDWDSKYITEVRATTNYPKSILSSYPPGFHAGQEHDDVHESSGARLCTCETRMDDPNPIVRINTGVGYRGDEPRPTEIPFMAAGFFFTTAQFLVAVPFDPYMPWLFMGEELALSIRSWTSGFVMYAPRKNWIAHQYRPGRLGLPKFWESSNNLWTGLTSNNRLQDLVIPRVKHMLGYPDALTKIQKEHMEIVLKDFEFYSLGKVKTFDEYFEYAHMKINPQNNAITCTNNEWCNKGLKS